MSATSRKIAVVTGSRAEYGLLRPLMEEIRRHDDLTLILMVTGMHFSPEFGSTYQEIIIDGFTIDYARTSHSTSLAIADIDRPDAKTRRLDQAAGGIANHGIDASQQRIISTLSQGLKGDADIPSCRDILVDHAAN